MTSNALSGYQENRTPSVTILLYREETEVPVLEWLERLPLEPEAKIRRRPIQLSLEGHQARRPLVENLGDGIYELRVRLGSVNYRILFGFIGRTAVLLTCGFTKERTIPTVELERAQQRLARFLADPANHCAEIDE